MTFTSETNIIGDNGIGQSDASEDMGNGAQTYVYVVGKDGYNEETEFQKWLEDTFELLPSKPTTKEEQDEYTYGYQSDQRQHKDKDTRNGKVDMENNNVKHGATQETEKQENGRSHGAETRKVFFFCTRIAYMCSHVWKLLVTLLQQ